MNGDARPEISAVIPCLNEAENAAAIAAAVTAQLAPMTSAYEIIFIDNGSTDATVPIIKALCAEDPHVRLIVNTRNFGQMRSPTHGIYAASGKAIIGICADFQDPPELIPELISRWRAGALIVLGVRESENASWILRTIRAIGYGFFERFGDYRVIPNATGFGLYDRQVVDCLRSWREPEPFFRGMLVESGFALETIPYHRPERAGGVSKNDFFSLLSFALSGLVGASKRLLRAPIYLALIVALAALLTFLGGLITAVMGNPPWVVFGWSIAEGAFAILCFFLGLIGEQVRVIAEVSRNIPLVIESERVNFPAQTPR